MAITGSKRAASWWRELTGSASIEVGAEAATGVAAFVSCPFSEDDPEPLVIQVPRTMIGTAGIDRLAAGDRAGR